jgi:hypothetical protein
MQGHSSAKGSVEEEKIFEQEKKKFPEGEGCGSVGLEQDLERKTVFHLCAGAGGGMLRG